MKKNRSKYPTNRRVKFFFVFKQTKMKLALTLLVATISWGSNRGYVPEIQESSVLASIQMYTIGAQPSLNNHTCVAIIIAGSWVLTNARCCLEDKDRRHVYVGSKTFDKIDKNGYGCRLNKRYIEINRVVLHPEFDFVTFKHDLCLVKTGETIPLSPKCKNSSPREIMSLPEECENVCRANLGYERDVAFKNSIQIIGWSRKNYFSRKIDHSKVTYYESKDKFIDDKYVASGIIADKFAYGMPLMVVDDIKHRQSVLGLFSFNDEMFFDFRTTAGNSFFTPISSHLDWIVTTLGNDSVELRYFN